MYKNIGNSYGFLLMPAQNLSGGVGNLVGTPASSTLDAAGESAAAIGYVVLSSPGTSRTISAAGGGKIHWRTGAAITFADAGTTLRVGLQDVAATGLEDGTFDVYADLVGGTDTVAATTSYATVMESGSKTLANGDFVAIAWETTARGGSDSVTIAGSPASALLPYGTADTGSGPAKVTRSHYATIEFDDGTFGWLPDYGLGLGVTTAVASNTTPDEIALVFRLPWNATITGVAAFTNSVGSADDFEFLLYENPLSSPVAVRTLVEDATLTGANTSSSWYQRPFPSAFTATAGTYYALALRPTTTGTINYGLITYTGEGQRLTMPLGVDWAYGSRSDQTGAFTLDTTKLPLFGLMISSIDANVRPPRTRPLRSV